MPAPVRCAGLLRGAEGAFVNCTFWLADALFGTGREREAHELFERLLDLRDDLGLLSEEYDPASGRQLGNTPQAYSHVGWSTPPGTCPAHIRPAIREPLMNGPTNRGRPRVVIIGGGFAGLRAARGLRRSSTEVVVVDRVNVHTACRHGLPIKVLINNNNALGQILREQMVLGYPEHGVRFGDPQPDFAALARACGGFAAQVDGAGDLRATLVEAFTHRGPALVDVAVDPNEPPMPGKVGYEQAKKFAQSFLHGEPHKASIATTLLKDKIQQMKGD